MLPVLIVCYLRPEKLDSLLKSYLGTARKIYVFIDRADTKNLEVNRRVFDIASKYMAELAIKIHWSEINYGVGKGVPAAIDWAFGFETELIILEDDCAPSNAAYLYFEDQREQLNAEIVMAAASSPWSSEGDSRVNSFLTLSNYPLIWGWMTNVENWKNLQRLLHSKTPHLRVFRKMLTNPSKILAISYFYAAVIRVNKGRLGAWDSPLALEMLLSDLNSITSNVSLIENSGQDQFASHFSNPDGVLNEVVSIASANSASSILDTSKYWKNKTNKRIEKSIYNMKYRQLLSPAKAIIGL
jgi:hypothetical protein